MVSTQVTRRVVVGCDGSWHSHHAVLAATLEAVRRDADLVVLTVPVPQDPGAQRLDQVMRSERDAVVDAEAIAVRGLAMARELAPDVRGALAVCALGSAALPELLSRCELLALGHHGRGGQRALSLGSTSSALARAAASPLLLVGTDSRATSSAGQGPVVVGFDDRPAALHALDVAATQATLRRAPLVVVRVVPYGTSDVAAARGAAELECAAALGPRSALLPGMNVVVTAGPTIPALLAACGPTSLLVVGNRGVGRLAGPVAGSLTENLLAAAPCDVLLVSAPASSGPEPDRAARVAPHRATR